MGKKGSNKKRDATARKADPKVVHQDQQNQPTDTSAKSRTSFSGEVDCIYCELQYSVQKWVVQCDVCDKFVHFDCAGISEIREGDPWSCQFCQGQETSNNIPDESQNPANPEVIDERSEDEVITVEDTRIEIRNDPAETVRERNVENKSSTRVNSTKSRSKYSQSEAVSSNSSSRRREMELERLEEELKLQAEVDAETLALKLEAVKLKQARNKKFLDGKYKALSSGDGSVVSKKTTFTQKSSFVSDWVENQRKQAVGGKSKSLDEIHMRTIRRFDDRIDQLGFDAELSIPVDPGELTRIGRSRRMNPVTNAQESEMDVWLKRFAELYGRDYQPAVSSSPEVAVPSSTVVAVSSSAEVESQRLNGCNMPPKSVQGVQYGQSYVLNDQMHDNHQQQKIQVPLSTSHFNMPPKSRSTLLYEPIPSSSNGQYVIDVQKPNQTYVFSRNNRPTSPIYSTYKRLESMIPICSTSEANTNQRERIYSKEPVVPPVISTGTTDYYRHIYSDQNPASSSEQQNVNYGNNFDLGSANKPISSRITADDGNGNRLQRTRQALTSTQIAARHAIPKDLPQFGGNPKDWCRFIKRFNNSTDICGYSDDENLERLDKCLHGKAYRLVESLLLMPDSVPEIIETLYEKYGRPQIIIKCLLKEIREHSTIKPEKLELLSDYGYTVRNACKQIEDLNMRNYLYNPELIQEVVDKLPFQTRIDWARHSENLPSVTLRDLADWMHKLSRTINRITLPETTTSSSEQKNSNVSKSDRKGDNSKSGHVNMHDNGKSSDSAGKQLKCQICEKDCRSAEVCSKFKGLDVDQRWNLVIANKICRRCLKLHKPKCHSSKECGVNGCQIKHHQLLHNEQRHSKGGSNSTNQSTTRSSDSTATSNRNSSRVSTGSINAHFQEHGELFRVVPVNLYANNRTVSTYAYLDEGSSFTLMERTIADKLDLLGIPETICLMWTNNVHRKEETEIVNLEISGTMDENNKQQPIKYPLKAVNVVQDLNLPEQSLPLSKFKRNYEHLRNIPMAGYDKITPTLLIGTKHAKLAVPLETVEGMEDGPIATRSRLGWSIYGPINCKSSNYVNTHRIYKCPCKDRDDDLHKIVKDHFLIENSGISINPMNMESKENQKALDMLRNFTIRKGNRFETRLLWKNEKYILPDSYGMACKRLACVENKGSKVVSIINDIVKDYLAKGYASKLSQADLVTKHPRTFYLPIFTVKNPKKPEKIRPVFDAAATVRGTSLNSALLTGPDLLSPLVDVLRRFREHQIAITGDIREMFYRVLINEIDRPSQRFLWRDGDKNKEPDVYQFNVMTFGSKCSPSSAQFVKNVNASEYEVEYPRAARSIVENHYVDDMLDGARNVQDAIKLIKEVKFIHSQAGFEIRNFKSNSEEVLRAIGETTDDSKVDLAESNTNLERVLGMFWETKSDCFMFSLKYTKVTSAVLRRNVLPTKREILRLVMSLFDPLGLISYYVIHAKILLQDVWRSKIGWDEKLPDNLAEKWYRWIKLLPQVENLKIPRWYSTKLSPETPTKNELHIFVDAGDDAFAAVIYLRIEDEDGVDCSLVGSKAKVAPLKYLSTPRKELMAGVLGSRLINSVEKGLSLEINRRTIWTDSTTVLTWLHSEHKKYSQFVAHRIGEILENTNLIEWRWVPTKLNVADEEHSGDQPPG